MKLRKSVYHDDSVWGWIHWCPGCNEPHGIPIPNDKNERKVFWDFNGDMEKPTFSPSVKITLDKNGPRICHYILTGGMLQFCGDSTHALAGKTVPLPDFPATH